MEILRNYVGNKILNRCYYLLLVLKFLLTEKAHQAKTSKTGKTVFFNFQSLLSPYQRRDVPLL